MRPLVIASMSRRRTGARLPKLYCPQMPHIGVTITQLSARGPGGSGVQWVLEACSDFERERNTNFEILATEPSDASAHCPNQPLAYGPETRRQVFAIAQADP